MRIQDAATVPTAAFLVAFEAEMDIIIPYEKDIHRTESIRIAGHQISTIEMWNRLAEFEVYISDAVIGESLKGNRRQSELRLEAIKNFNALEVDDKSEELASLLLQKKAVPHNSPEDALHIAVAAVNGIDFIVTWNFKHINNPRSYAVEMRSSNITASCLFVV